ncbi:MAG: hypothetical protein KGO49_09910, partial [Gammaproteobacteria bacterium]|nr:hypothetical protein [Gammaproteobacteria bacterium]
MNSPARKIKKSAVKNIVRFPSIKANGGKPILVESILESKYCLHLEFDSEVVAYFPQPRTFNLPDDEDGQNIYTPDFEVHYVCGARKYVEVKPFKYVQSAHYQGLFSRFEDLLQSTNIGFLIVSEIEIYQEPLLSNYEKLYQFRKRPFLDMKNLHQCAEDISDSMPLVRLMSRLGDRVHL